MGQGNFKVKEVRDGKVPRWQQYAQVVVGKTDLLSFLKYELIVFLAGDLPGALGLYLRGKLYPLLLGEVGSKVVFGRGITLRHPHKIRLGSHVILDDHCVLDAKGASNDGISIGDEVFIGRNSIIYCKDGDIEIQARVNIGANCQMYSKRLLKIGQGTMVAAYNCILSGGQYDYQSEIPFAEQSSYSKGPTVIGEDCWLGAQTVVLDGVSIGDRTVVGAGAVVTKDLPGGVVATGVPAKVKQQVCL
jgi:acetyltransferase-like isoleucine patch superfamily enzyme